MLTRRTFLSLVAGGVAMPGLSSAQPASSKVALYANVGADLTHYDVDVAGAATRHGSSPVHGTNGLRRPIAQISTRVVGCTLGPRA